MEKVTMFYGKTLDNTEGFLESYSVLLELDRLYHVWWKILNKFPT
jgi:hypothetical protein